MTVTPADRLRAKQPRRLTIGIYLDEAPADRLDALNLVLNSALQDTFPVEDQQRRIADIKADQAQAERDLEAVTEWFTFQALGRSAFARLMAEHPPTQEDIDKADSVGFQHPDFHGVSFAPALISASLLDPKLSLDEVQALYEDPAWNVDELGTLFATALIVNTRSRPMQVKTE